MTWSTSGKTTVLSRKLPICRYPGDSNWTGLATRSAMSSQQPVRDIFPFDVVHSPSRWKWVVPCIALIYFSAFLIGCWCIFFAGAYSCLRVEMTFARQLSFFVVTIYVPCFMIVVVSWMSFWIDHKAVSRLVIHIILWTWHIGLMKLHEWFKFACNTFLKFLQTTFNYLLDIKWSQVFNACQQVPARVSLGVTTLLAMSTTQASINSSLPPVAYTKVNNKHLSYT